MEHGLVVDKLHRVCEFKQSKWLGVYIEKNTVMRKQAKNDFELLQVDEQRMFRENQGKLEKAIGYKVCVQSSASRNICSESNFQILLNY